MSELPSVVRATASTRRGQLRVCLVIGQLGLGGTEKQVVLLADGLRRRGVDVTVVVLTTEGPREAALREAGVPVVYLGLVPVPGWRAVAQLAGALVRLTRYFIGARPHLVHAFLFHSYVLTAPAARLAGVPVVVAGRRSLDDFKRGHHWALAAERIANRLTHLLVANAYAVADCVRTTERVPARKVRVIYNGLPEQAFNEAEPALLDTGRPVVLCVANLKPGKGHASLLEAGRLLRKRRLPCTFVFAGFGPEHAELARRAAELRLDVRLLGARQDVDRLIARADVVVLASMSEGMPNAVMEAMAAGRPVVATSVGGTPELLGDGRGILVRPGDARGLADAVAKVLGDPDRAREMGRAARRWSRTHLHCDTMVQQHLDLYAGLVGRRCAA
ncbi:glycosyltransferase [Dactylosporangium sp. CA-092794]|uniref:glycosyltransferase n=1 Tax=Dactylosporangium sp. CA-092794 TaxID=3239929 RepID=UPI003D8DA3B8